MIDEITAFGGLLALTGPASCVKTKEISARAFLAIFSVFECVSSFQICIASSFSFSSASASPFN